jgi:hypothetical protein
VPKVDFRTGLEDTIKWYQAHTADAEQGDNSNSPVVTLYTGNHSFHEGIEDIIEIVKGVFKNRGVRVHVKKELNPETANLIIESFKSSIEIEKINKFRTDNPKNKIYFILTEFFSRAPMVETFNYFGGMLNWTNLLACDIYLRKQREDFNSISRLNLSIKLLLIMFFNPLLFIRNFKSLMFSKKLHIDQRNKLDIKKDFNNILRMHKRFLGYDKLRQISDGVILLHKDLLDNRKSDIEKLKNLGTINGEINCSSILPKILNKKTLQIVGSGSLTNYRRNAVNNINENISLLNINYHWYYCEFYGFNNIKTKQAAFSIHPPQSKAWEYCSPTRLYRALATDHTMPIITKNFNQSPIENLCIEGVDLMELYHIYEKPDGFLKELELKIGKYNDSIRISNDRIVESIIH